MRGAEANDETLAALREALRDLGNRLPPEVRGRLRAAIDEMHRDGSLQRMLSRHVGEDLARKMLVPMP